MLELDPMRSRKGYLQVVGTFSEQSSCALRFAVLFLHFSFKFHCSSTDHSRNDDKQRHGRSGGYQYYIDMQSQGISRTIRNLFILFAGESRQKLKKF